MAELEAIESVLMDLNLDSSEGGEVDRVYGWGRSG
jgi:hypothetical protein